jgi:transposase
MHEICRYIEETFYVHYSIPGIHKWLHRNKFSYKQPEGVPHKYDSEKQDDFVEAYETLKEQTRPGSSLVFCNKASYLRIM